MAAKMKVMVVEEYDRTTGTWTAEVAGARVRGRTPRQLRGEVARALGKDVEVERRLRFEPELERRIAWAQAENEAVRLQRDAYLRRLDALNVERLAIVDALLAQHCTLEMIGSVLGLQPTRVQQLCDPRSQSGRRVRALRDGAEVGRGRRRVSA